MKEKTQTVFKEGERVYHHLFGWGEIQKIAPLGGFIGVKFECNEDNKIIECPFYESREHDSNSANSLSRTSYDLINGGWSR